MLSNSRDSRINKKRTLPSWSLVPEGQKKAYSSHFIHSFSLLCASHFQVHDLARTGFKSLKAWALDSDTSGVGSSLLASIFSFLCLSCFPYEMGDRVRTSWTHTLSPLTQGWAHGGCDSLCEALDAAYNCMSAYLPPPPGRPPWVQPARLGNRECSGQRTKEIRMLTCSEGLVCLQARDRDRSST